MLFIWCMSKFSKLNFFENEFRFLLAKRPFLKEKFYKKIDLSLHFFIKLLSWAIVTEKESIMSNFAKVSPMDKFIYWS